VRNKRFKIPTPYSLPPIPHSPLPTLFFFLLALAVLLTGCVSQYKVVVKFSPVLQNHFTEYPTIEVDIAAVTDIELGEVKQAGVEKYFAPNSALREQFQSQTCFFFRGEKSTFVLPSRAPIWKTWKLKDPTTMLVIASLPPNSSVTPQADPRYLTVKMAKSYIIARTLNVLVEPERITQVKKSSLGSQSGGSESQVIIGQYIESR
jgi:hypothetical protein